MPPLSPTVLATLQRFRSLLDARFGARVREVRLFGSWARGEATEESDADVLVTVDELTDLERLEIYDLGYDADSVNEWLVMLSPLPYSTDAALRMRTGGRRLFREIDQQGVPL